ncbi:MAG: fatty acid amide hydrolase 2, partial [Flavobacteriales bacterium]
MPVSSTGVLPDPLNCSAVELARRVRDGDTTSAALVEAFIARIEHVNPAINAMVADRFSEAREEAAEADRVRASAKPGTLGPLHGVPCSIKECFALTGMPQCAGLESLAHRRATTDATAVRRLRQAGAIPLGVTNLSELCMWMESNNRVYGRTNNPHALDRIVGGSSGGEGAIVAARGAPFGLGSDIGGSIRLPAFFNGVFGHKPTGGLVPSTGQFPASSGTALRYLCSGPISHSADDLMPLLRILAGPDGEDPSVESVELGDTDTVSVDGMRVLNVRGNGFRGVAPSLRAAQQAAADALAARGAEVIDLEVPALKKSLIYWATLLGDADQESFRSMLENGEPKSMTMELCRWAVRRSPHTLPAILLAAIEGPAAKISGDVDKIRRELENVKTELSERI